MNLQFISIMNGQIPYGYHYIVPCQVSQIGLDLRIIERDLPGSMSRSFRSWVTK